MVLSGPASGPCLLYPLSPIGTPLLRPRYQASSLLWVPPTPPVPLSSSLVTLVRECVCLYADWRISTCGSTRPRTPGWLSVLALARKELWPAGPLIPSAFPNDGLFGALHLQGQHHLLPFAPRLLSCLRINQTVTNLAARLDSRPVASGYLGRLSTCKITRHCQIAANE